MQRSHDLVLFGATGFTGSLVAHYLAQRLRDSPVRWALAGRDLDKLARVREAIAVGDRRLVELPLVRASSDDAASLAAMAGAARVVLTTVGPYVRYGMPLARACVEQGCDYVDLTGEPAFWHQTIDELHARAVARGVLLVSCCGFDSIPHDLGAYFTARELGAQGPIEIDAFVYVRGSFSGGTWTSAIEAFSDLRKARGPRSSGEHGAPARIHFERSIDRWVVPMPTIDPAVVRRSAEFCPTFGPELRYRHFLQTKSLAQLVGLLAGVGLVVGAAQSSIGRKLLLKVRKPGEGPPPEQRARNRFAVTFLGRGDGKTIRTRVSGHDPGYDHTAKMIAEAALTLVEERGRLSHAGGVLTPASALGEPLLARLRTTGMEFTVESRSP